MKPLITLVMFLLMTITVYAHPGRLDEYKGHWERATGEYHFHDGDSYSSGGSYSNSSDYYVVDDQVGKLKSQLLEADKKIKSLEKEVQDTSKQNELLAKQIKDLEEKNTELFGKEKINSYAVPILSVLLFCFFISSINYKDKGSKLTRELLSLQQQCKKLDNALILNNSDYNSQIRTLKYKLAEAEQVVSNTYGEDLSKRVFLPPANSELGNNSLPKISGSIGWGNTYTVYVSNKKSKTYHCKQGCSNAYTAVNIYTVYKNMSPCKRCNPNQIDLKWVDEEMKIRRYALTK